jgi:hypothetical protein
MKLVRFNGDNYGVRKFSFRRLSWVYLDFGGACTRYWRRPKDTGFPYCHTDKGAALRYMERFNKIEVIK